MRIHESRKRDCSFARTEQDSALKHFHIDSLSTLGIRRCNAVCRTPAGESANRSARRHLGFDRHSAVRKRISKSTGSSMNRRRIACLSSITVLCLLTCPGLAGRATAQDAEVENPRGMCVVMPLISVLTLPRQPGCKAGMARSRTDPGTIPTTWWDRPSSNTTATITTYCYAALISELRPARR